MVSQGGVPNPPWAGEGASGDSFREKWHLRRQAEWAGWAAQTESQAWAKAGRPRNATELSRKWRKGHFPGSGLRCKKWGSRHVQRGLHPALHRDCFQMKTGDLVVLTQTYLVLWRFVCFFFLIVLHRYCRGFSLMKVRGNRVEQIYRCHFFSSNSICSLRVCVSHFGPSGHISNFPIIIIFDMMICDHSSLRNRW